LEALRQKLKLFNYRSLVLVFLGILSGILVSNFIKNYTLATIIGIIIVVGVLLFYSILHKTFKYFVVIGITFILGFGTYSIYINIRTHKVDSMIGHTVVGTVTKINNYDTCLELILEDIKIDNKELDCNATVYYYNTYQNGYVKLEKDCKIKFSISKQDKIKYFDENGIPNTYNFSNNIGVEFTTYEVELLKSKDNARTSILKRIRNNLRFGLNNANGEMIYSAMFGDKTNLNHDLYDSYKSAGVAHLLAVSGLHVGLVVAILYWILRKLKVKDLYRVIIISVLLFGYAYLCDFSYSIIRASIMSIILMIAPLLFSEYDLLSSICFAGSIIILIEPIALFDLSAQLSFGCVFGIATLTPLFQRLTKKIPISNAIKDGFSISLSTVISTSVFMAYYFRYLQPISLISNIIILPLFGVLFTITFILSITSLILPFICFILILINPLFEWLNWAIMFIADVSHEILTPNVNFLTIILFGVWLTFVSKFNLYKGFSKLTMVCVCSSILALQMAII